MTVRPLERDEIESIWTLDRSEVHHHVYVMHAGQLRLVPHFFNISGWAPGQVEETTPQLYTCFDNGGTLLGMFHEDELVGAAVLDNVPFGPGHAFLQLKMLYVSRKYRRHGVGTRLFQEAQAATALERGYSRRPRPPRGNAERSSFTCRPHRRRTP